MYELVGYRCEYTPDEFGVNGGKAFEYETEEVVAKFDNKKDAEAYIENSKLKHRIRQTWSIDKVFKRKSLLWHYERAWIQERKDPDPVPHNPVI